MNLLRHLATAALVRAAGGLALAVVMLALPRLDAAVVSIDLTSYGSLGNPNGGGSAGSVTDVANFPVSGPSLRVYNAFTSGFANPNVWGLAGSAPSGGSRLEFAVTGALAGIRNFAAGESISSSETFQWGFEDTTFRYFDNVAANFGPGSYVGFRFTNDDGSTFNYGYLETTWDSSTTTFQILSGAYETTAGLAVSVPEPSTISLLAVATLVGGLFLRRRDR